MVIVSKSLLFCSSLLNAEQRKEASPVMEKQGIVTILSSENSEKLPKPAASSLRRTLSADMSSKKWLEENGVFSPGKKNPDAGSDSSLAVWGSILSKKSEDSSLSKSAQYVPPLVKRSTSCLSEKSLEICTESLGSETGSDCAFSSYPASESSDVEEEREDVQEFGQTHQEKSSWFEDFKVVKYKNSPPRPLPPPIHSIADGSSIRIHSHRSNGRLVLEAVSVPPRNYFRAQRHNDRLVLTWIYSPNSSPQLRKEYDKMEEIDQDVAADSGGDGGGFEEEEAAVTEQQEEEEERVEQTNETEDQVELMKEHNSRSLPIGGTIKKFMGLGNKDLKWTNKIVNLKEVDQGLPIPHSLPPRPAQVARPIPLPLPPAATSFNSYHYFWRNKAIYTPQSPSLKNNACLANGEKTCDQSNPGLIKGKKDEYIIPLSMGCKNPRRPMSIWEPYCIATS